MTHARETEAAGIFATHGLLDAATTTIAALHLSHSSEANPIIRVLLQEGVGFAVGSMLLVVGLLAAAWPRIASRYRFPRWFAPTLCAVGLIVAVGNLVVVLRV